MGRESANEIHLRLGYNGLQQNRQIVVAQNVNIREPRRSEARRGERARRNGSQIAESLTHLFHHSVIGAGTLLLFLLLLHVVHDVNVDVDVVVKTRQKKCESEDGIQ
jgi:hypothetical protein